MFYNSCLVASRFPACWKSSVVAVFNKSDKPSHPSNYQPISVLPLFGKVLESLINFELAKHLTSYGLLSDKQYGFCLSRSTADILTIISEFVSQALYKKSKARVLA